MSFEGWLLDCYVDSERDRVGLWVREENGRARGFRCTFIPHFFVRSVTDDIASLRRLGDALSALPSVGHVDIVERLTSLESEHPSKVLDVPVVRYAELSRLARTVSSYGGYMDMELFNVDLRLPSRYMVERGLFPLARVRVDGGDGEGDGNGGGGRAIEALDPQWALEYRLPPLRSVSISVDVAARGRFPTYEDPLAMVVVRDGTTLETIEKLPCGGPEDEEGVLRGLMDVLGATDPDIVLTDDGDGRDMPFLYQRAAACGIGDVFFLGREGPDLVGRREKSYFTYGRIVHKPKGHLLKGRHHVPTSTFHYQESGMAGIFDLARISTVPIQEIARLSPGTAISTMQLNEALRTGVLVKWRKNTPEMFKSARDLLAVDRGGLIFEPRVGLHGDVFEVDFASLYPNIMVNDNISPETLMCGCCAGTAKPVPGTTFHFCQRRKGLVPRVLEPIIARRMECKRRARQGGPGAAAWKERNDILKWVLVVCFGYTGYRNARYGRIECHESITARARRIIVDAANIAESMGYRVLHGIVDSMWLQGTRGPVDEKDHRRVCDAITRATGVRMEYEGAYRWVVFLPNKGNGVGALNRYYGAFSDGTIKARGIELRRRDTPPYFSDVQNGLLCIMAGAKDPQSFMERLPLVMDALRERAEELASGAVDMRRLVFKTTISRSYEEYGRFNDHVAALAQLRMEGLHVMPGQVVRYVVTDASSKDPLMRVAIDDGHLDEGRVRYDADKYIEHLCRCGESMLLPFGYTLEMLRGLVRKGRK